MASPYWFLVDVVASAEVVFATDLLTESIQEKINISEDFLSNSDNQIPFMLLD